jgi:hypothetical protein
MPLSLLATSGPYESVLARGFAYREASDRPHRPIVLVGMLMMFVPVLVGSACALGVMVAALFSNPDPWSEIPRSAPALPLVAGGLYVSWKLITKTLRNYFRLKREALAGEDSDGEDSDE